MRLGGVLLSQNLTDSSVKKTTTCPIPILNVCGESRLYIYYVILPVISLKSHISKNDLCFTLTDCFFFLIDLSSFSYVEINNECTSTFLLH